MFSPAFFPTLYVLLFAERKAACVVYYITSITYSTENERLYPAIAHPPCDILKSRQVKILFTYIIVNLPRRRFYLWGAMKDELPKKRSRRLVFHVRPIVANFKQLHK